MTRTPLMKCFVGMAIGAAVFSPAARAGAPASPALTDADWQRLPAHPRLFATPARFEALRTQRDPVTRQLVDLLRHEADAALTAAPVVYPTEGTILFAQREVLRRVLALAMTYRLTGERHYFDRARQELLWLSARQDWGLGHFLDVGEASLAAGIGLDWLHDELSPADRDQIGWAIVNRALQPSLYVREEPGSWVNGDFNWNQVCHAGLAVGALAVAEREPKLARTVLERAVRNLPAAGAVYAPDGAHPEGPSYWSYGTSFHVVLIEALRGALGTSCGLEKFPGFLPSTAFHVQTIAPTGEAYNFSDYHAEHFNEPIMLWFARELGQREVADDELANLAERAAALVKPTDKLLVNHRLFPLELLWWQPDLPAAGAVLPLHWTAGGIAPLAVMRSAWNDPRATYLAIKGGTPDHSHGHMDVGSFILEANGIRWALDLGTENYDRMRTAKLDLWNYSQASTRWTTFRVGPEGHNLMRFDSAPQDVTGHAEVRALPDQGGVIGNVVELSPLYKNQVEAARRTVRLFPDRSVSVEDHWTAGVRATEYAFQWLTKAQATVTAAGAQLAQGGEKLDVRVESPDEFHVEIQDVLQPHGSQDSPNPGLFRIVIRQKTPAHATGNLKITAAPLPPDTTPRP